MNRISFVGIRKDWKQLREKGYVKDFVKYHLELPWYYAYYGGNIVTVFTKDFGAPECLSDDWPINCGELWVVDEMDWDSYDDIVVHWRKWFPEYHNPAAANVINSQDHSYGDDVVRQIQQAHSEKKLHGVMCFPTWHERRLGVEFQNSVKLISGLTLGVDTRVYKPEQKDPHMLLWASDPGRGLGNLMPVISELFHKDKRFKLHVCWPDYVKQSPTLAHPAVVLHQNMDNGPELWDLFKRAAFVPYASTFPEPSSRVHRQGMSSGCVVLYPPSMGTPSHLIDDYVNGVVRPIESWAEEIMHLSQNACARERIGIAARVLAMNESWEIQAKRFNAYFDEVRKSGQRQQNQ